MIDRKLLIEKAFEAQENCYTPYSNFNVGAALLCENGDIYTGCNIENAAFTPTNCAERTAFFKAVSEGQKNFTAIAVVGNKAGVKQGEGDYCAPCAVCRQVMAEFCDLKNFQSYNSKKYRRLLRIYIRRTTSTCFHWPRYAIIIKASSSKLVAFLFEFIYFIFYIS